VHEDRLSHYTATKAHCKNVILMYNQFKGGRHSPMSKDTMWLNFCMWRVLHLWKFASWCFVKHVYSRTGAEESQQSRCPSKSITDDNVCCADAVIREDGPTTLTYIAWELDILLCNTRSIVHDQLDYRKVCAQWVPKNFTNNHKACHTGLFLMHLTHDAHEEVNAVHFYTR
jgi:hypothetical protein